MFGKSLRTAVSCFVCVCMILLNVPRVDAAGGKPMPPQKRPPKEKTEKPAPIDKPEKLAIGDNQKVIEYVTRMKEKNPMVPVFAQLAQRYLSKASDKNELDMAFERAVKRCPKIEKYLPRFVDAYNAIPVNLKQQKFILPDAQKGGKATTDAITAQMLKNSITKAFPDRKGSPAEQTYMKRKMLNKDLSNIWKNEPFDDTEIAVIEYVERPRITHLTPTGREPGETLTIYGMRFQEGKTHKVILTSKDIENADPEYYEEIAISSGQIDFDIPDDLIPGNYRVEIQAPGMLMVGPNEDNVPISDPASYEFGLPKYKVYFNLMKCIDETRGPNNENIYKDSLVTFWGVGADERGWFKHSKKYQYFEDGTTIPYDSTDKLVLTPNDQWHKVQYGLVVCVDLYEWNWTSVESGDSDEILDFTYCFYEEMSSIDPAGNNLLLELLNLISDLLALILTPLVDLFVNLFTADPRHIDSVAFSYTSTELQNLLKPGQSTTGDLNFDGQDGEYELRYLIKRK